MGIGIAFHEFLLKNGYTLEADDKQTLEMQMLLKKLSKKYDTENKNGKSFFNPIKK